MVTVEYRNSNLSTLFKVDENNKTVSVQVVPLSNIQIVYSNVIDETKIETECIADAIKDIVDKFVSDLNCLAVDVVNNTNCNSTNNIAVLT